MTDNPNLWEVRTLPGGLALELWGAGNPALMLTQGERWVGVELPHVKGIAAALVPGAADLSVAASPVRKVLLLTREEDRHWAGMHEVKTPNMARQMDTVPDS